MQLDEMIQNIDINTKGQLADSKQFYSSQPEDSLEPVDVYQRDQDRIYEVSQKSYPNGSSRVTSIATARVIDGAGTEGLAHAYKRAKEDIDSLEEKDEPGRAELRRKQYMQEYFLPAVEIVVNAESPDSLLANKRALADLDQYVLLPSKASGKAYTAQYVRKAYGNLLGQTKGRSDASVRSDIRRINMLLDNAQIREAVGIANKLKQRVDKGEVEADNSDMELIERIVAYYA